MNLRMAFQLLPKRQKQPRLGKKNLAMDVHLEELIPSEKLVVEKFLSASGLCPFLT